jgi:hypothetical protein
MNYALPRKQLYLFVIIIGLLLGLFAAVILTQQPQEIRKRAAGTGELRISLNPASGTYTQGQSIPVEIVMVNGSTSVKKITVAGLDLGFDPNFLTALQKDLACSTDLPVPAHREVNTANKKISFTCFVGGGVEAIVLQPGDTRKLGTVTFTANSAAANGNTAVTVVRTNVPDSTGTTDLSDAGTGAKYTIGTGGNSSALVVTGAPSVVSAHPVPVRSNNIFQYLFNLLRQLFSRRS